LNKRRLRGDSGNGGKNLEIPRLFAGFEELYSFSTPHPARDFK
jgi:hypothetical protein